MGDDIMTSPEGSRLNVFEPPAFGSDSEQGLATATLALPISGIENKDSIRPSMNLIKPYLVTEVCRKYSPLYEGGLNDEDPLGIDDKAIDLVLARTKAINENPKFIDDGLIPTGVSVPEAVAYYFANRTQKMLNAMETLHGQDYAARAKILMNNGHLPPEHSPQGVEDRKILADVEQGLSAFMYELNAQIPEGGLADTFRKKIYKKMTSKRSDDQLKSLYAMDRGEQEFLNFQADLEIDSNIGIQKESISTILAGMSLQQRSAWLFLRNVVKRLSHPVIRTYTSSIPYR